MAASSDEDRHCIHKTYGEHLQLRGSAFTPHSNPMGREVGRDPRLRLGMLMAYHVCCGHRVLWRSISPCVIWAQGKLCCFKEKEELKNKCCNLWNENVSSITKEMLFQLQSKAFFFPLFPQKSSSFVWDALRYLPPAFASSLFVSGQMHSCDHGLGAETCHWSQSQTFVSLSGRL